jgi:NAD(P)H-dependent flavin oxidoreductase YrpB (nitropropane dioxygenase family)
MLQIKSKFCEMFGVEYPIMAGGMHYASYAELAAAVSNAGGLGIINALTHTDPQDLRKEIQKCRALTKKPFGVNLTIIPAFIHTNYHAYAQVVVDEKVPVVEIAGKYPEQLVKFFKSNGVKLILKCIAIRHALSAQKQGVDMVSIGGFECGGHTGEVCEGFLIMLGRVRLTFGTRMTLQTLFCLRWRRKS